MHQTKFLNYSHSVVLHDTRILLKFYILDASSLWYRIPMQQRARLVIWLSHPSMQLSQSAPCRLKLADQHRLARVWKLPSKSLQGCHSSRLQVCHHMHSKHCLLQDSVFPVQRPLFYCMSCQHEFGVEISGLWDSLFLVSRYMKACSSFLFMNFWGNSQLIRATN